MSGTTDGMRRIGLMITKSITALYNHIEGTHICNRLSCISSASGYHVLGTCLGYKLRRDINKIRHYCKELCTHCGGQAAPSRDVCVCNMEEAEGVDVQQCLERARNKFEFLGIKLETQNRPVNKRSIYRPHHPSHPDDQGAYLHMEPDQEKRALFRRSSTMEGIPKGVDRKQKAVLYGDPSGPDDKLRSKRSYNDYGRRFDLTRIAELFQQNYPIRPPTNFKILLGSSKQPGLDRGSYYDMMGQQDDGDDEDCSDNKSNSSESSDYDDGQIALGDEFNLRRFGNKETNMYELLPPPDMSQIDDSTAQIFNSIWDSVLLEALDPDYHIPSNIAETVLFV